MEHYPGKPHLINIAPGNYALFFEAGLVDEERAATLEIHNLRRYDAGLTPNWFRFSLFRLSNCLSRRFCVLTLVYMHPSFWQWMVNPPELMVEIGQFSFV